ncbi:MAG: chemotaxis response regulator protein-glutamate methylesterase [Desulfobulbus propionicus]|nr:MAG: chemotaxis response regulator protein-glutamate methylesterase [Desulfobulbus propionicus]
MANNTIKVLVVDDTIVYRKAVSDILQEMQGVEVVGVAHNGQIAISKIKSLQPDLLTLDIEMPQVNGLEVLQYLQKSAPHISAIMVSTLTSEGGDMTMKALELGAFDFILKPNTANIAASKDYLRENLTPLVRAFQKDRTSVASIRSSPPVHRNPLQRTITDGKRQSVNTGVDTHDWARTRQTPRTYRAVKSEIVTIGISTGGPNALAEVMPALPGNIGIPILIVQHMPPVFTKSLATSLNQKCALEVKEAEDREPILPNTAYIAPGGKQMKIIAAQDGIHRLIRITDDPPENSCKPSADYLFRSVGDYYLGRTTAVIMTGMGSDGTKGLEILRQKGAYIIGQDEATSVVYGMPKAPAERGLLDEVVSLGKIADAIVKSVR